MKQLAATVSLCIALYGNALAQGESADAAAVPMTQAIPAQPLAQALDRWARISGLQVIYGTQMTDGKVSPALPAGTVARDGLDDLLQGSGLTATWVNSRTVTLKSTATTSPTNANKEGKSGSSHDFRVASVAQTNPEAALGTTTRAIDSPPVALEEIVVTAQKRAEKLQDVPIPVTAISGQALLNSNALRLQDYYTSVPGLSVAPANESNQVISIRGITTGGSSNSTVGVMIDDVPFGSTGSLEVPDIDPGDLARVEILRGPQGTLYGASSMGGLLKLVTIDPAMDALSGRVEVGTTSVRNGAGLGYGVRGSINIPVSDEFAVRASGFTRLDPGYIDNPVLGLDGLNKERVSGARLAALWRPWDATTLKLSALYQDTKGDGANVVEVPTATYPSTVGLGDLRQLQQNDFRNTGGYERKVQSYSATINSRLGAVDFVSLTGFNINTVHDDFDYTYALGGFASTIFGVPGAGAPILFYENTEKFTQELRLSGSSSAAVDWLVGGFFTHESFGFKDNLAGVNPTTAGIIGTGELIDSPGTYKEYAAFADITLHLTGQFDVQIGGRESQIRETSGPSIYSGPYTFSATPTVVAQVDTRASAFTYLLTPRFKITPDSMVYARLASGYRPGGGNPGGGTLGTPLEYRPDKTQNYEVGWKADFLGHALSLDASVYYIDWKDIQIQLFNPQADANYNTNGSRARSRGVELSTQAKPMRGLVIDAWATYDDAVLTEPFPTASPVLGLSGDRLPNTSRFSGNLSVQEDFPITGPLSGYAGAAISYVGDRQGVFTSTPQRQDYPAYAKTDLRAGVQWSAWRANLYVNNVTDKRGIISGGLGLYPPFGFYVIQPRTVGVAIIGNF